MFRSPVARLTVAVAVVLAATPTVLAQGLQPLAPWRQVVPQAPAAAWTSLSDRRTNPLAWRPVSRYEVLPPAQQPEVAAESAIPVVDPATLPGPIFGIGTGYHGFAGDRSSPVLTGRLGYAFGEEFGVSLRPTYIFLNRDLQGVDNSDGAFQMPLTLDLFPRAMFSPYFGAGIATNTDTNNTTDAMLTGGIDLNLVRYLTLGLNVNYIFESSLNDTDWEAMALLYFRF
jgi:hypothetical protein